MPLTIYPYRLADCWVFDDPRTGLKEEAFVLGASEMISRVVEAKAIPEAAKGFALKFDAVPFDHDVALHWINPREASGALAQTVLDIPDVGNWYRAAVFGDEMVCWLCPALFLYFDDAPRTIYAKGEPLPAGVDPIWHVAKGDQRARRFVSVMDAAD
jgi:hypothetical protein